MKKLTIVLTTAIFTLVIALGLIGSQSKADEVTFHNSQVEAAIRQQLEKSKGKIYKSDLKRVEVLSISGDTDSSMIDKNKLDLATLQQCTDLKLVMIFYAQVNDFSWISSTPNLQSIIIDSCTISNLDSLSSLSNLSFLSITDSEVGNISDLAMISSLKELHLCEMKLSNLTMLSDLKDLTTLRLFDTGTSDISPLARLTHLTELDIRNNAINDLSPLLSLSSLERLFLDNNRITDLSVLTQNANFMKNGVLTISNNPLSEESISIYIAQMKRMGGSVTW